MDDQFYVLSIEGFISNSGSLIPKEIAIVSLHHPHGDHWILEAPYYYYCLKRKRRNENLCITLNRYGLRWEDGDVPYSWMYERLNRVIRTAERIYTYGRLQMEFLQDIANCEIMDVKESSPSLDELPEVEQYCIQHAIMLNRGYRCAFNNAIRMKDFILHVWSTTYPQDTEQNSSDSHESPTHYENIETLLPAENEEKGTKEDESINKDPSKEVKEKGSKPSKIGTFLSTLLTFGLANRRNN